MINAEWIPIYFPHRMTIFQHGHFIEIFLCSMLLKNKFKMFNASFFVNEKHEKSGYFQKIEIGEWSNLF